jgi:16S rRNA (uracil1498-N3)-methyltransferase
MELFYSKDLSSREKQILLSGEESRHLQKVMRKKRGDIIQITNGKGLLVTALIAGEKSQSLLCDIQSIQAMPPPAARKIHIALSTIRPNRLDWAVEKLTELGVGSISFFRSQFTSVRSFKAEHLQRIAISAIKQSRQCFLPQINSPLPYLEWIQSLPKVDTQVCLLAYLSNSSKNLSEIKWGEQAVFIAIGPEGGFSDEELNVAAQNEFKMVRIDDHILRTETAAVIAAAQVKLLIGE